VSADSRELWASWFSRDTQQLNSQVQAPIRYRDCVTSLEVRESNVIHSTATIIHRHVTPDINFFYSLFNFIFVFEVLMLRLQNHSNYHFCFEYRTLRKCSMRIQNTPRATQREFYWLIQGGKSYWLSPSFAHFFLTLVISWRR
jgi:hypothetical protein